MAVERAEWPDWGAGFLNDEAPLAALAAAIEERAAAAGVGVPGLWSGTPAPTVLSRLAAIRTAIATLAPAFVDLDNPANAWAWGSHAPLSFQARPRGTTELPVSSIYEGEHSLAAFSPGIGAPEAHEPTLAAYRKFLADCAWWLERFRYVDVGRSSYYLRRIDEDSDGNAATSDVQVPVRGRQYPAANVFHSTNYGLFVWGDINTENWQAGQLARLRIGNPAPLDGEIVILYRCGGGDVDGLLRVLSIEVDEQILRKSVAETIVKSRIAGQTVQTRRSVETYENESGVLSRRTDATDTAWSADGTLSADTTYTAAEGGSYETPTASRSLFLPALVAPLENAEPWTRLSLSGTVPARGSTMCFDNVASCPRPADMASWSGLLPDTPATRPGTSKKLSLSVSACAWLVVLLDYNASFRYRAEDAEEEEEEPAQ